MRESRSYGSVGERGGDEPLYPELIQMGYQLPPINDVLATPVVL